MQETAERLASLKVEERLQLEEQKEAAKLMHAQREQSECEEAIQEKSDEISNKEEPVEPKAPVAEPVLSEIPKIIIEQDSKS